ncbi:DUF2157 domain-containing protein [Fontimonas sp. SYSU GA230001]|uniref:DUF2157 domain-containing protein n=1 Tax=Fontimonas sp. SYSU GA230001 TaxID=3142450 RepID=UPI0032B3B462
MKPPVRWLLDELPRLIEAGVLDAAAAGRLRQHYAAAASARGVWARVLFPLLGIVLIGLGLILLIAHNWDHWSKAVRLTVAFVPLLLGQLACGWTLLRAADSRAWRESSAAFTALAFAAALALVGQIYHFPGDLDRFLLTCALVGVPLVYLLDASLLAVLCAAGFAGWAAAVPDREESVWSVVVLFALLVPHVLRLQRAPVDTLRLNLLLAGLAPAFFAASLVSLPGLPRLGLWWLAQFGAVLVMFESARGPAAVSQLWQRPLALYGGAATTLAALIGSFPDVWRGGSWLRWSAQLPGTWLFLLAGLGLLVVLAWRAWLRGDRASALQVFPAVLMAVLAGVDSRALAALPALLLSAYVLVQGLLLIRDGLTRQDSARSTRGLGLIALLVVMRFVDAEWSFTARGIAFLLAGAAFMAAHVWLRRRVRA